MHTVHAQVVLLFLKLHFNTRKCNVHGLLEMNLFFVGCWSDVGRVDGNLKEITIR